MDERLACLASVLPLKWSVKNENERKKFVDLIVFLVFGLANSLKPIDFIFFIFLRILANRFVTGPLSHKVNSGVI